MREKYIVLICFVFFLFFDCSKNHKIDPTEKPDDTIQISEEEEVPVSDPESDEIEITIPESSELEEEFVKIPEEKTQKENKEQTPEELDPDEFVTSPPVKEPVKSKQEEPIPVIKVPQIEEYGFETNHLNVYAPFAERYSYEIILVVVLVFYGIIFFHGKSKNDTLAIQWAATHRILFYDQFAYVGCGDGVENASPLEQQSYSCYNFYASGRVNVIYSLVTIELKRRQDLFTMVVMNIFSPEKDRICLEIPLCLNENIKGVFAIVKKKDSKKLRENYPDLKNLCKIREDIELPKDLCVISEYQEISKHILNEQFRKVLEKHSKAVSMIHLSDLKTFSPHELALRVDLELFNPGNLEELDNMKNLIKSIFNMIDHLATFKMSDNARSLTKSNRKKMEQNKMKETAEERKEENIKKKMEKKKAKEEKTSHLSTEMKAKIQEKERKREIKNRQKKLTKFIKV